MLQITPIDSSKTDDGAWTTYRGVKLKVARSGNDAFAKKFTRLVKPIQNDIDTKSASDEILEKTLSDALAGTVLVDWKPFKNGGEMVKYSDENAADLLYNDRDCRKFVQDFANDIDNFLRTEEEVVKGK